MLKQFSFLRKKPEESTQGLFYIEDADSAFDALKNNFGKISSIKITGKVLSPDSFDSTLIYRDEVIEGLWEKLQESTVQHIEIDSSLNLTNKQALSFFSAIKKMPSLKTLAICSSQFGEDAMLQLWSMVTQNLTMEGIICCSREKSRIFTAQEVDAISYMLRKNNRLQQLTLPLNQLECDEYNSTIVSLKDPRVNLAGAYYDVLNEENLKSVKKTRYKHNK